MLYLYFILFGYSLFRGIRGCFRIITSYRYIKSGSGSISKSKSNIKFHILIPVLREQEIIEDTIKHFAKLKGNYVVYLITTEKETYQKQHCKNNSLMRYFNFSWYLHFYELEYHFLTCFSTLFM